MPAATVACVPGSMRMKEPVSRFVAVSVTQSRERAESTAIP